MCKCCDDYEGYKAAKNAMENYLTSDNFSYEGVKPLYITLDSYTCFTYYNGLGWVDVFLYDGGTTFENDEYTFGKLDEYNTFNYCPHCGRKL